MTHAEHMPHGCHSKCVSDAARLPLWQVPQALPPVRGIADPRVVGAVCLSLLFGIEAQLFSWLLSSPYPRSVFRFPSSD
jgi:hypothetical protein